MDRPVLPTTDHSAVWLADLIKAIEVVAASSQPCDPATVKAFSDRLAMRRTGSLLASGQDHVRIVSTCDPPCSPGRSANNILPG
jgi:hypothetical protein